MKLPITDGHAPGPDEVEDLHAVTAAEPGITFLHCAAGVGRSTSLQMAYCARMDLPHTVHDQLAIGPASL
ncbi:MAG: dual specificity protein phosphatase family protein, partial [Actinobacteria bacterium]|nr:dual specificity protein phosphatase family protein [Actinomycetota bacterium]